MSLKAVHDALCVICNETIKAGESTRPLKTKLIQSESKALSLSQIQKHNDLISWSHLSCVSADDERVPICKHWSRRSFCMFQSSCLFRHPTNQNKSDNSTAYNNESNEEQDDENHENRRGNRGRRRVCNDGRAGSLRRWILDIFGIDYLKSGSGVLDIAGGKGELAFELVNLNDIPTCVIDPRKLELNRYCRKLEFGYYHRNDYLKSYNCIPQPTQRNQIQIPTQLRCYFEMIPDHHNNKSKNSNNAVYQFIQESGSTGNRYNNQKLTSFYDDDIEDVLADDDDDDDGIINSNNSVHVEGVNNMSNIITNNKIKESYIHDELLYQKDTAMMNTTQTNLIESDMIIASSSSSSLLLSSSSSSSSSLQLSSSLPSSPLPSSSSSSFQYPKVLSNIKSFTSGLETAQITAWTNKGLSTTDTSNNASGSCDSSSGNNSNNNNSSSSSSSSSSSNNNNNNNDTGSSSSSSYSSSTTAATSTTATDDSMFPVGVEISDLETARLIVKDCSLVVGMHPDQAAEHILDFAIRNNKPCAFIPCCVYSSQFPRRKKLDGTPVRKYGDLIEYLLSKLTYCVHCTIQPSLVSNINSFHIDTTGNMNNDDSNSNNNSDDSNNITGSPSSPSSSSLPLSPPLFPNFGIVEMDFEGKNLLIYYLGDHLPLKDPYAIAPHIARGPAQSHHWWKLTDGYKEPHDDDDDDDDKRRTGCYNKKKEKKSKNKNKDSSGGNCKGIDNNSSSNKHNNNSSNDINNNKLRFRNNNNNNNNNNNHFDDNDNINISISSNGLKQTDVL